MVINKYFTLGRSGGVSDGTESDDSDESSEWPPFRKVIFSPFVNLIFVFCVLF